ncbi:MAG: succinylglutamate desuccinylase/aspartoacylase family protein [Thermoplasmata archaeon]|nr:succinylglutamate desuccinylase/aspartoacylase family protein [Thermoplasmata archaeon]
MTAAPGTKRAGYLKVAEHPDGSDETLPFVIVNGKEDGPSLWLTAAEHGDEVLSTASIVEFVAGLDPKQVRGKLIAFPALCSTAFNIKHRFSPIDSYDFSRAWPGFRNGWLAQQVAAQLLALMVEDADYVINVHNGLPGVLMPTPYIIATYNDPADWEGRFRGLTESFLLDKVVHWIGKSTERGARMSTMMAALLDRGIPSVVPELGPETKEGLRAGLRGYTNCLKFVGMLPGKPERLASYRAFPDVVHIFPTRGGVFKPFVTWGDEIKEGQKLGSIKNFDGTITEELIAPAAGMIIAKWMLPMIGSGDFAAFELATFAEFKKSWPGER